MKLFEFIFAKERKASFVREAVKNHEQRVRNAMTRDNYSEEEIDQYFEEENKNPHLILVQLVHGLSLIVRRQNKNDVKNY